MPASFFKNLYILRVSKNLSVLNKHIFGNMMLRVDFMHFQLLLSKAEIKDFIKTQKTKNKKNKQFEIRTHIQKTQMKNKDSND